MKLPISKKVQDEILEFVKEKTGAEAIVVLLCDSKTPCSDEFCKGHKSAIFSRGVKKDYLPTFLEVVTEQIDGDIKGIVSPYTGDVENE